MNTNSQCLKCFRSHKTCLCSFITKVPTHTFFVLLMHPKEYKRERLGTGRLTHLCLPNSKIIMGVDFSESEEVNNLINDSNYRCFVLYPSSESHNISIHGPIETTQGPTINKPQQDLIFIIDATWPCARKMMKLSRNLHNLPHLSFTPTALSQFRFKKQPHDLCLSTIEVVHTFISQWEKPPPPCPHNHLLEIFQKMVQMQIDCSMNPPSSSYRASFAKESLLIDASLKKKALKWERRNLFFSKNNQIGNDSEL